MALIVQKYGGTSVGNLDRIHAVAQRIIDTKKQGHSVVVVVSAMYGETDRLIRLANAISQQPNLREYDVLISTGEQMSMALLSIALNDKKCPAKSFTGSQIGILTDNYFSKARILEVKTNLIHKELSDSRVVVIAGFQGITPENEITTLGRGGSDTTAVAIAAALKADECQIYTDVDGVYTTDPHLLPEAKLLPQISFEEMLEMSSLGAKVLQMRSVELASKYKMPIRVLSSFSQGTGTLVTFEDKKMNKRIVSGIAFSKEEAIISLLGLPKCAGIEGNLLDRINQAQIEIDMIVQNTTPQNTFDFSFTVNRRELQKALSVVEALAKEFGSVTVKTNPRVAKLSLVGLGMRSQLGVASTLFKALGEADIIVQMIATSEIKISIVLDENHLEKGVRAIHHAFQLDKISATKENALIE